MDLTTTYMGLELRNPLVASASPLSQTVDGVRRLADAGVGAVVLYSLFEEQLHREAAENARLADAGTETFAESLSYFPDVAEEEPGPRRYLSLLERSAAAVAVPVIGSLNGITPGGWTDYARAMQDAGAAAIELNIYSVPTDLAVSGAEVERRTLEIVREVAATVQVPVSIKLVPYFTSIPHVAAELVRTGADGLVLFNRLYAPDIDLATLRVTRSLPLSTAAELPLSLVWIALLSRRIGCSLAAGRGVETHVEVVKYLLVGADVVMTASALLRRGAEHLAAMREGLERWLGENGYDSVDAIRGLKDATHVEGVDALLRAQYVAALTEYLPGKLVQ